MRWYATAVLIGLGAMALLVGGCSDEDCTTPPPQPTAAAFVGSETCGTCHNGADADFIYDQWKASGHPYKIVKIEGEEPTASFPTFSAYPNDIIDPPQGKTWGDITYTIGGYFWKMRWIDSEGWIVTSPSASDFAQYNFETDTDHSAGYTTYHTGEDLGTKPYDNDCGRCHTTGWVANPDPDDLTHNQDGLAGIHGTFFAGGIHCEECHGKGSLHAGNPTQFDMVVDDSAALCGRCHTRDPLNRIMASKGFIRHHEQYDEWRHSPHGLAGGPGCNDCHDPHASVVYDDVAVGTGVTQECTACHTASEYTLDGNAPLTHYATVECTQCHMPKVGKSAKASDSNPKYVGDVASHIFAINSDAVNMEEGMGILADGASFIKTDEQTGLAKITLDFACYSCHTAENGVDGGGGSVKTLAELSAMANGIHPGSTKSQRIASR